MPQFTITQFNNKDILDDFTWFTTNEFDKELQSLCSKIPKDNGLLVFPDETTVQEFLSNWLTIKSYRQHCERGKREVRFGLMSGFLSEFTGPVKSNKKLFSDIDKGVKNKMSLLKGRRVPIVIHEVDFIKVEKEDISLERTSESHVTAAGWTSDNPNPFLYDAGTLAEPPGRSLPKKKKRTPAVVTKRRTRTRKTIPTKNQESPKSDTDNPLPTGYDYSRGSASDLDIWGTSDGHKSIKNFKFTFQDIQSPDCNSQINTEILNQASISDWDYPTNTFPDEDPYSILFEDLETFPVIENYSVPQQPPDLLDLLIHLLFSEGPSIQDNTDINLLHGLSNLPQQTQELQGIINGPFSAEDDTDLCDPELIDKIFGQASDFEDLPSNSSYVYGLLNWIPDVLEGNMEPSDSNSTCIIEELMSLIGGGGYFHDTNPEVRQAKDENFLEYHGVDDFLNLLPETSLLANSVETNFWSQLNF